MQFCILLLEVESDEITVNRETMALMQVAQHSRLSNSQLLLEAGANRAPANTDNIISRCWHAACWGC